MDRTLIQLLHDAGFKATPARLALLEFLKFEKKPLRIEEIQEGIKERVNLTTIYRAVEALARSGVIERVDLGHTHAHYEMKLGREHHHHVVCVRCGKVEDVEHCETEGLEYRILRKTKKFSTIEGHSLEFRGMCRECIK